MSLRVFYELPCGTFCCKEVGDAEFEWLAFAITVVIVVKAIVTTILSRRSSKQLLSFSLFPFYLSLLLGLRE